MELSISNSAISIRKSDEISFRGIIIEFLDYIKKPQYISEDKEMSFFQKIRFIFKLLLFKLALLPLFVPIIVATKAITGAKALKWDEDWMTYAIIVVLAPLIEELLFRGILKYSRTSIALMFAVVLMIFTKTFFVSSVILGFAIIINILLLPVYRWLLKPFDTKLSIIWSKSFPYIFHTIALSFGLIHLSNYSGINNYFLAIPLIMSQIISGYVLGFVRMKFGIKYSIGLHSTWNFIVSFGLLFALLNKLF